jgi:hypothetical protein
LRIDRYADRVERGGVFSAVGKWQLRGVVVLKDGEVASEPVTVEVSARSREHRELFDKHRGHYYLLVPTSYHPLDAEEVRLLTTLRKGFDGTYTGTLLKRGLLFHDLSMAERDETWPTFEQALKAIDEYAKTLEPVGRAHMNHLVANVCHLRKRHDLGRPYCDGIDFLTKDARTLRDEYAKVKAEKK